MATKDNLILEIYNANEKNLKLKNAILLIRKKFQSNISSFYFGGSALF